MKGGNHLITRHAIPGSVIQQPALLPACAGQNNRTARIQASGHLSGPVKIQGILLPTVEHFLFLPGPVQLPNPQANKYGQEYSGENHEPPVELPLTTCALRI